MLLFFGFVVSMIGVMRVSYFQGLGRRLVEHGSSESQFALSARLDRDRDGLLVFFVGVVLFRAAAAVYFLTNLLVAAAPVVMLASGVAIASPTSNTSRRVVGQWGGAGGASCEDHFCLAGEVASSRGVVIISLARR